jgi:hypothetical protein
MNIKDWEDKRDKLVDVLQCAWRKVYPYTALSTDGGSKEAWVSEATAALEFLGMPRPSDLRCSNITHPFYCGCLNNGEWRCECSSEVSFSKDKKFCCYCGKSRPGTESKKHHEYNCYCGCVDCCAERVAKPKQESKPIELPSKVIKWDACDGINICLVNNKVDRLIDAVDQLSKRVK